LSRTKMSLIITADYENVAMKNQDLSSTSR
jgi:hypothetical protein